MEVSYKLCFFDGCVDTVSCRYDIIYSANDVDVEGNFTYSIKLLDFCPIMDPSLDIYFQHELNFRVYTLNGI